MKEVKTYRLTVDSHRNGIVFRSPSERLYSRNTEGVYYVGAKSPEEAKELLQQKIRFGSITVPKHQYVREEYKNLKYKEIVYMYRYGEERPVRAATDAIIRNEPEQK